MGRFSPNLSEVTAGIPLLDKGEYEFSIGEMKPFTRTKDKEGIDVEIYGVRTSIKVLEGSASNIGATIPMSFYLHSDESARIAKQFPAAANGFNVNVAGQEAQFNEMFPDEDDWSGDPETGELGDAWKSCQGKRIRANVTQTLNKLTQDLQNQYRWLPF
jgi:hypothetical protein